MDKYIVKLSMEEREGLLSIISKGKACVRKLTHARILLEADENQGQRLTDEEIAQRLHVNEKTVHRVRKQLVEEGLERSLERKKHSRSKPRKLQGEEEAHLLAICCSRAPEGRSRWTLKLLSDKLVSMEIVDSISPQTIWRTLKKRNKTVAKEGMVYRGSGRGVCL